MAVFIYIMHEDSPLELPSPYYYATGLLGYLRFGFDEKNLISALTESGVRMTGPTEKDKQAIIRDIIYGRGRKV